MISLTRSTVFYLQVFHMCLEFSQPQLILHQQLTAQWLSELDTETTVR
jgi:hypothetical protein